MEKAFSPRSLTIRGPDVKTLQAFGKVRWTMNWVDQDEPRDTASQIVFLLNQANWEQFTGPIDDRGGAMVGVAIYLSDFDKSRPQAEALAAILTASGIEVHIHVGGRWRLKDIAPDGIQIAVGRKPTLTFTRSRDAAMEESTKERNRVVQEFQQRMENLKPPEEQPHPEK
jgi:hypothetical protein